MKVEAPAAGAALHAVAREVAVIIPTLNAACYLPALADALARQSLRPKEILVIDSSSTDDTVSLARSAGYRTEIIPRADFRHGATRRLAVELVDAEVYVFLTQDAAPAGFDSLELLVGALFADADIGMAFGRHLPHPHCSPIATHNRLYNYPPQPLVKRLRDRHALGLKTCFASDAFAAYRADALRAVGSFPKHVIGCEDVFVAARMLLAGYAVCYAADAEALHSHDNTLSADFKVFFDIGAFYAGERWIMAEFGGMEGDGLRYLRSEIAYLLENGLARHIPLSFLTLAVKYAGFRLGLSSLGFPRFLNRALSSFPGYWSD